MSPTQAIAITWRPRRYWMAISSRSCSAWTSPMTPRLVSGVIASAMDDSPSLAQTDVPEAHIRRKRGFLIPSLAMKIWGPLALLCVLGCGPKVQGSPELRAACDDLCAAQIGCGDTQLSAEECGPACVADVG